jgi:hypothetical protein
MLEDHFVTQKLGEVSKNLKFYLQKAQKDILSDKKEINSPEVIDMKEEKIKEALKRIKGGRKSE